MTPTQELAVRLDRAFEGYQALPSEDAKDELWEALLAYVELVFFLKQHAKDEDFVVDQASRILLHLGKFKGNSNFSTWVFRVVSNHSIRWAERQRRAKRQELPLQEAYRLPEAPAGETRDILMPLLAKLPPKRRRFFKLLLGGLSQEEAALKLKISRRTASWLYKETIKQLKELINSEQSKNDKNKQESEAEYGRRSSSRH